jgi:hypothetical protein
MLIEMNAAVQSGRVLWDFIKTNKQLANASELHTAVSKLNAELARAWEMTLDAQEKQSSLQEKLAVCAERVRQLEKELGELKDWNREAERYQLGMIAPSVPAYSLKPGMENDEPPHHLCANCFARKEKSFLQYGMPGVPLVIYRCTRCQSTFTPSRG